MQLPVPGFFATRARGRAPIGISLGALDPEELVGPAQRHEARPETRAAQHDEHRQKMSKAFGYAFLAATSLLGSAAMGFSSSAVAEMSTEAPSLATIATIDDGRGTDYVVTRNDNICGLDDPRQLTRPARVDHAKLIALTPQMQLMKREKINPNSARGIHLRTEAAKLVSGACEKVRGSKQYCSVWKKIRRRDGKKIADITALVKRELGA